MHAFLSKLAQGSLQRKDLPVLSPTSIEIFGQNHTSPSRRRRRPSMSSSSLLLLDPSHVLDSSPRLSTVWSISQILPPPPPPDEPQPSGPPFFYLLLLGSRWDGLHNIDDLSVTVWVRAGILLSSCWVLAGMLLSWAFLAMRSDDFFPSNIPVAAQCFKDSDDKSGRLDEHVPSSYPAEGVIAKYCHSSNS